MTNHMLAQSLLPMLAAKFGDDAFATGDNPLVTFAPAHEAVGELRVFEVDREGRIEIGNLTHGHFYSFGSYTTPEEAMQELAENLFDFICDLFARNTILWRAKNGGSGGWFHYDASEPLDLPVAADKADWFFWSGPIANINSLRSDF